MVNGIKDTSRFINDLDGENKSINLFFTVSIIFKVSAIYIKTLSFKFYYQRKNSTYIYTLF